jgi:selenocysteine lyase/cysteine desulfurase
MGPLGTGVLYIGEEVESELVGMRQGGTGSQSESERQPEVLPDAFESGNHNVPGILGLGAAVKFLTELGWDEIIAHERRLTERLLAGLRSIEGVRIVGPKSAEDRVGVVSLQMPGYDPHELAAMLEAVCGVQSRAGLHCAARMHRALGTLHEDAPGAGGTLRLSIGRFNTEQDIDDAIAGLSEIAAAAQ